MMFRSAVLLALFGNAAGQSYDIPAMSKAGSKLLANARRLDNNNQNQEENSWMAGYSLKFESCKSTLNSGNQEGNGGGNDNDANAVAVSRIVEFRLCPSGKCSTCNKSGLYAVAIEDFVMAYMEVKREAQQAECEAVRENCYNDDEYYCYQNAGLDYCGDENDIQRYMECAAAEFNGNQNQNNNNNNNRNYYYYNNNNNNNNNNRNGNNQWYNNGWYNRYQCYNDECQMYVGAKCSDDGKGINLGLFVEETCSVEAPDGTYEQMNYGYSLPYSKESMIDRGCQSCIRQDNNGNGNNRNKYYYYYYNNYYNKNGNGNNGNQNGNNGNNNNWNNNNGNNWWYYNQNYEVSELCAQLYEDAYKCEENLTSLYYPDSSSCYYIKTILPKLDALAKENSSYSSLMYWSIVPIAAIGAVVGARYLYNKRQKANGLNDKEVGAGAYVSA